MRQWCLALLEVASALPRLHWNFHQFAFSSMNICKTIAKSGSYSCRDLALHGMSLCWPQSSVPESLCTHKEDRIKEGWLSHQQSQFSLNSPVSLVCTSIVQSFTQPVGLSHHITKNPCGKKKYVKTFRIMSFCTLKRNISQSNILTVFLI